MNKKGSVNILLLILVLILAIALLYVTVFSNSDQKRNTSKTNSLNVGQGEMAITNEYVKKVSDSANEAVFVFTVPVESEDITSSNIKHCVISASAGSRGDGPECTETTTANSFLLQYNESTQTLKVSDPNPGKWGPNSGPFRIGCVACFSAVEFSNIHAPNGQLLPRQMLTIY